MSNHKCAINYQNSFLRMVFSHYAGKIFINEIYVLFVIKSNYILIKKNISFKRKCVRSFLSFLKIIRTYE